MIHSESINDNDYDSFRGKKGRARKAVRVENRKEKKAVRLDNRKSRVENRRSKAQSRLLLAEQGIATPSAAGEVASGLGGFVKNIFGGGGNPMPVEAPEGTPPILMQNKVQEAAQSIGGVAEAIKTSINQVMGDTSNIGTFSNNPSRPSTATGAYVEEREEMETRPEFTPTVGPVSKMKKNMPLIIGGIVLVVVVVLVVVFKKKK